MDGHGHGLPAPALRQAALTVPAAAGPPLRPAGLYSPRPNVPGSQARPPQPRVPVKMRGRGGTWGRGIVGEVRGLRAVRSLLAVEGCEGNEGSEGSESSGAV